MKEGKLKTKLNEMWKNIKKKSRLGFGKVEENIGKIRKIEEIRESKGKRGKAKVN